VSDEEERDEISLPKDSQDEDVEHVYGIAMPKLPEGMQPLECVVLIQGIEMENGMPTITALGSEGMTPWMAVGMMAVESQRLTMGYTLTAVAMMDDDEDEDG
jgi:hypothetical protein